MKQNETIVSKYGKENKGYKQIMFQIFFFLLYTNYITNITNIFLNEKKLYILFLFSFLIKKNIFRIVHII